MNAIKISFLAILASAILFAGAADAREPIAVIVNSENLVSQLTNKDIRKIYRNNVLKWSDGTPITLYDLTVDDPVRKIFSKEIFRKSSMQIAQRWAHLKITNQAKNPPLNMKSQKLIIRRIAVNKGAIGYVSLSSVKDKHNSSVKIVAIIK